MDRFSQALYDKFELNGWFNLAAYKVEETTEAWTRIISCRNSLQVAIYMIRAEARKILGKDSRSDNIDLRSIEGSPLVPEWTKSLQRSFIECLGTTDRWSGIDGSELRPNTLRSSVLSLRPIDYFVGAARLADHIKQYGLSIDSRFNLYGLLDEIPEKAHDALSILPFADLTYDAYWSHGAPLIQYDKEIPHQSINDLDALLLLQ